MQVPKLPSRTIKTIGIFNFSFLCASRAAISFISLSVALWTRINEF
jgi:hypothetical protein